MAEDHPLVPEGQAEALKVSKLASERGDLERTRLQSTDDLVGSHDTIELPVPPPRLPPPPRVHVTTERIPVLPSAPPSGADLTALALDIDGRESFGDSSASPSVSTSLTSTNPSPLIPPVPTVVMDLPPPPKMSGAAGGTLVDLPPPPLVPDHPAAESSSPEPSHLNEPSKIFFPPSPSTPPFLATRQTHIPILVISTEHANEIAWRNNLRLTDLLGGLSRDLTSANVPLPPFRSSSRSMLLNWRDLQVSFVSPSDFEEGLGEDDALAQAWLHEEAALRNRDGVLGGDMAMLEDQIEHLLADESQPESSLDMNESDTHTMVLHKKRKSRLEQVTRDAYRLTSPPDMPWLVRYRRALDATTDYLPHELFHTPPLVLLVCSSHEVTSPLDCLRDLGSMHYLPQSCFGRGGIMDPQLLRKEALVLHDEVEGPTDLNEIALKQALQRQYGNGATVVRVNSIIPGTAQLDATQRTSDLWDGGGGCGHCLSGSDLTGLRRFLATMITSSLLPALERRIADLNLNVTDKKKGVKNVFKSLWRKPKEDASPTRHTTSTGKIAYRYDSIESQVRLLADTLFLLRDWDAAYGMYRLIKDDYKHDRAMMHYASIQEMMALSSYMLDSYGRSREVFSYIETALYSYTRVAEDDRPAGVSRPTQAPLATRLATRLCLVLSAMSQIERPLEVADLLASASSHETPLGAAVLLEQSSSNYYHAEMYRKYAFHMLMSGHMFRSAAQEHHAFRCFTSALYIYHDGRWDELHNHLRSALAAQLYSLGRMAVSLELYAKLVGTDGGGRVSVKSQQKFVNHLLDICRQHANQALLGADRMAMPGSDSKELRKARFDRMDQVLSHTPNARRVLELPNMDLPHLDKLSISVMVEAVAKEQNESIPSFGTFSSGDEKVWQELICCAEAELKVTDPTISRSTPSDEFSSFLDDPLIHDTIAQIDKEKANLSLMARAKKSGRQNDSPSVQARMEPLVVSFSMHNPLNVSIELSKMQLVARIVELESKQVCTAEDGILIEPLEADSPKGKTWTFQGSNREFAIPDFARVSPTDHHSGTSAWTPAAADDPFFVVTKENLIIDSESTINVSLGICPIVKGDLEILGIRCMLFGDVWTYHSLGNFPKNPLLPDGSHGGLRGARAESVLLKSRVEEDMPRLTAHIIPRNDSAFHPPGRGESPMLVGQISAWTIQITNAGTAPASALSLKTNMPWIRIESVGESHGPFETTPSPHCLGPSGTLLSIPVFGAEPNVIHPGETVDVPVLIRSALGGKQDFYMAYRYEHWDGSASSSKCRWLRKMVEVPVYPSLTFSASLMPSFWQQREHVLSVEMTNYRTDQSTEQSLHVDKLSILSRHYRLEPLEAQCVGPHTEASAVQLGWQERVTVHYRVIPLDSENEACMVTECPFDGGTTVVRGCTAAEAGGFLCLKHAHDEFEAALARHHVELARLAAEEDGSHPRSIAQIRRAKSSVSESSHGSSFDFNDISMNTLLPPHPTSLARLCPSGDGIPKLNIVCSWSAPSESGFAGGVDGENYITGLSVRPGHQGKGCPLTVTCNHPSRLTHDFRLGPLHISFETTIRNRLLHDSVDFEFSMDRPTASLDFIGAERFETILDAGEEITVPMQAAVRTGGVYNLQAVRITTKQDSKKVAFVFPLQWTVVVMDGVGA